MADLISKKTLIEKLGNTTLYLADEHCLNNLKIYNRIILEMPCINRWIPVSERLPKLDEDVLVCVTYEDYEPKIYTGYLSKKIYEKEHYKTWMTQCRGEVSFPIVHDVVAWMPLPEPYEPQESEDCIKAYDSPTNGSIFLKTYPNSHFSNIAYDDGICYVYVDLGGSRIRFTSDWWNATYKANKEE